MDGKFPVEILNEIRAIFQHFIRCYMLNNDDDINKNINKARSHLKRAILDCFKYICVSFDEEYKAFLHTFRHVDLREVNNGIFLTDITRAYQNAKFLLVNAKNIEAVADDVQECFNEYEKAYNAYLKLHNLITDNESYVVAAKKKQMLKNIMSVLGWVLTFVLGCISCKDYIILGIQWIKNL